MRYLRVGTQESYMYLTNPNYGMEEQSVCFSYACSAQWTKIRGIILSSLDLSPLILLLG